MNTPLSSSVTLLSDPPIKAKLREDIVKGDPDSVFRDDVPVFHGLSVNGDVTGQVVYAGYGRKRDFEALQAKGILLAHRMRSYNLTDHQVSILPERSRWSSTEATSEDSRSKASYRTILVVPS